jgi:hypothetical protein
MQSKKLSKETMKAMKGGLPRDFMLSYERPDIQEVTEKDFNEPATESISVACRSLLGC